MEIDLADAYDDPEALSARLWSQICIVGGGIAGLTLAHGLARDGGPSVTLLEAGPEWGEEATGGDPFGAEFSGTRHEGTGSGRVRAFGGTSLTWGGQLLPLPEDACWPVSASELSRYAPVGEASGDARQQWAAHGFESPALLGSMPELTARLSTFLPFSQRNYAGTLGRALRLSPKVQVVFNATCTAVLLSSAADKVEGVTVQMPDGRCFHVGAEQFVAAAGAVETCRLLLASCSVGPAGVGHAFDQVGRHFHDHLTARVAEFTGEARAKILAEVRPWVFGGRLHSLKLEADRRLREALHLPPAMAHITILEPENSGVGRLRELWRARQSGRTVSPTSLARGTFRSLAEVVRLGWHAIVRRRRYVSKQARVFLQVNLAQESPAASRVLLSDVSDESGRGRAVVDWRVIAGELTAFRRFAGYLRERLPAGLGEGVLWEPSLFAEGSAADAALLQEIDDARHAMGGAVMGADPRTSVVDPELRVHGVRNLFVASAAVFPDGSAQLPTETLIRLCERLARHLAREFGQESA